MTICSDEGRLIEAAQRDPARFGEVYERYFDRVYAFVARRVRNRPEAEDLTSEVFHHALGNLGRFEWRGAPFGAWLLRIAANAVADRWERQARERGTPAPPEPREAPPDEVAASEELARLFRHVRRLPPDQRRVIVGRFVKERSIRDLARELQKTEGAVKQLQFRAIDALRKRLSESNG